MIASSSSGSAKDPGRRVELLVDEEARGKRHAISAVPGLREVSVAAEKSSFFPEKLC
jgi:hypothetical protein